MTEFSGDNYVPTIDAILSVVDLEKVSVKNIRGALQELFSVDLAPNKKAVNDLILERYYHHQEQKSDAVESEIAKKAEMERQDALLALQLSRGGSRKAITRSKKEEPTKIKKKKKPKDPNAKRPMNSGFNRPMVLSEPLAELLGVRISSRPQVVKELWKYIKDRNLQDPKDGRVILCDDKFEAVFKKKSLSAFGMNRELSAHLFKDEEITGQNGNAKVKPEESVSPQNGASSSVGESESEED